MKMLKHTILLTFIICGLLSARTGRDAHRVIDKSVNIKSKHYLVKDTEDIQDKLDRKRSNKRRRKIRKPIKGLR